MKYFSVQHDVGIGEPHALEAFWTESVEGVIRGFHFQMPPDDQEKLITCIRGAIFDVILDLRVDSPTFLEHQSFELDGESGHALLVPKGCAHAFASLETSIVHYITSSPYTASSDAGIRWDSASVAWPFSDPILSERDAKLPALEDFSSPFHL